MHSRLHEAKNSAGILSKCDGFVTLTIKNMLSNFTETRDCSGCRDIVVFVCLSVEEEVFIFWGGVLYN